MIVRLFSVLVSFSVALAGVGCDQSPPSQSTAEQHPTVQATAIPATFTPDQATVAPSTRRPLYYLLPMRIIQGLSFVDLLHGWAYGSGKFNGAGLNEFLLASTADGGHTWTRVTAQSGANLAWPYQVRSFQEPKQLRFENNQDGWLFDQGSYITHDGGKTWTEEKPGPTITDWTVEALETLGGKAWRIEHGCPPCNFRLDISSDNGRTWTDAPAQPALRGMRMQLVLTSEADAWILATSHDHMPTPPTPLPGQAQYNGILFVTHDGGRVWNEYGAPGGEYAKLAALPGGVLWVLSAGQPSTGFMGKSVSRSTDGGQTWSEVSRSTRDGPLSSSGYVYREFASTSDSDAWMLLATPGKLLHTTDVGASWTDARLALDEGNNLNLMFIDSNHGWLTTDNRVFRTSDGGTSWLASEVP